MTSNLQVVVLAAAPQHAPAAACNVAVAADTTRYVAFVDPAANGDVPEAAQQVRVLEEHPEWAAFSPMRSIVNVDAIQTFDLQALIARTPALCLSGAVIRRSELMAVGGFDEGLRTGYDFDLWLRLARRGGVIGGAASAEPQETVNAADAVARIESLITVLERFAARYLVDQPTRTALRARIMWLIDRLEIEQAKCRMLEGHFDAARFHLASARRPTWQIRMALAALRLTPRLARVVYRVAPTFATFL